KKSPNPMSTPRKMRRRLLKTSFFSPAKLAPGLRDSRRNRTANFRVSPRAEEEIRAGPSSVRSVVAAGIAGAADAPTAAAIAAAAAVSNVGDPAAGIINTA